MNGNYYLGVNKILVERIDFSKAALSSLHYFFAGTRACPGNFVAEINLFIFFVSLLQNFIFELSGVHGPPCMKNRIGMSHGPAPFYVQVSERRPTFQKSDEAEGNAGRELKI